MNPRSLVLIVVAIAISAIAAFVARSFMKEQPAEAKVVEVVQKANTVNVLVAAQNLPTGTIVNQESVRTQAWPQDALDERYMRADATPLEDAVYGRVVRSSLLEGEPVTAARLVGPGERGFLAAVLTPGFRAITVPINQTSGLAGFIFPGDRVDMILTHQVQSNRDQTQRVSETVLYNLRVLAIDQRTDNQTNEPVPGSTVTFEVKPKIAEMVALVMQMGNLSLSLRSLSEQAEAGTEASINEDFIANTRSFTQGSDISALLPEVGARGNGSLVSVVRGAATSNVDLGGL
ncbi:MAG: Flp pilus assembly protein CpaB [Pseudomonadota bacterium]